MISEILNKIKTRIVANKKEELAKKIESNSQKFKEEVKKDKKNVNKKNNQNRE